MSNAGLTWLRSTMIFLVFGFSASLASLHTFKNEERTVGPKGGVRIPDKARESRFRMKSDGQYRDHGDHPRRSTRLLMGAVVFIRVPLAVVSCSGWLPGGRGARAVAGGGTDRGGPGRGRGSGGAKREGQVTGVHGCLLSRAGAEGELRPSTGSPTRRGYAIALT